MFAELIAALVVIGVLYLFSKKNTNPNLPPFYDSHIPFFGCFLKFGQDPLGCVRWAYEKFGDCFTLKLLGYNMTYMVGPEAQATFFRATDDELSAKEAYKFMVPVFGPGVVYDSPTEVMYEQLKFIRSSLALGQLKNYVAVIEKETIEYFERNWGDSGEADLLHHMNSLTILTASRCLMGETIRKHLGADNQRIAHLYHDLERGLNPLSFFFPHLPLPGFKRRDKARAEVAAIFKAIIADRRKNNEQDCNDIMGILMNSEYKDGTKLGDEPLAGMMIALLFAGQHTSSITSTWTALLLNNNKNFLEEVMNEQKTIRGATPKDVSLSFEQVKSMTKLENSIRETLRMYPPLIFLMRKVMVDMPYTSPITKKDYVIPAGHIMCVSPGAAMSMEDSPFTNPKTYNPHRWEDGEHLKHPFGIISFGGGRHGCPGENFGMIQIKTLMSIMFNKYDIEFPSVPPADYTSLVAGPKGPVMVKYKKKAL
jgi:sterol 14-demethylase